MASIKQFALVSGFVLLGGSALVDFITADVVSFAQVAIVDVVKG